MLINKGRTLYKLTICSEASEDPFGGPDQCISQHVLPKPMKDITRMGQLCDTTGLESFIFSPRCPWSSQGDRRGLAAEEAAESVG